MSGGATIHVVDDDDGFRKSLAWLLEACGFRVVTYSSGVQLFAGWPLAVPGCILLDMRIPGQMNGLQVQSHLNERGCELPVIFLTAYGDVAATVQAIKAGADDLLEKPVTKAMLVEAIERALLKYEAATEVREKLACLRALVTKLTAREREVFGHVIKGTLNKQIAFTIGCGERTVKAHRQKIVEKLQVKSFAEMVSI